MIKIAKFGGSSVADAEHFKKIKAIVDADPARRFVVVSACGRRFKGDTKVTDLLYLVSAHVKYHVSCEDLLKDIGQRYFDIADELELTYPIREEFAAFAERASAGGYSTEELVSRGEQLPDPRAFAAQLANNLIPQIGGVKEEGFTSEEMKLQNEGRKIMHLPELRVNCTCVRVPVLRSHSESITLEFERDITVEEAREALAAAPGVKLVDDMDAADASDRYPMPLFTSDQDLIWVGRVRRDISNPEVTRGITFWCCGDQIRKGAATNAVQIAKLLTEE